jgi:EAL domain-containing protein (putative c-di-GMP-specific phosphodiesterase class I)
MFIPVIIHQFTGGDRPDRAGRFLGHCHGLPPDRRMAALIGGRPMLISVNVAGRQFVEGDLHADVIAALEINGVPPDLLELELTESALMANTERTITTLKNLKRRGVQISIDDFGTGNSSLAYLRRFPIDKLKIDISFIREVTSNPDDAAIVLAILGKAHSLKLDVIAEGMETAAQLAFLKRNHCDQVQGYLAPILACPSRSIPR